MWKNFYKSVRKDRQFNRKMGRRLKLLFHEKRISTESDNIWSRAWQPKFSEMQMQIEATMKYNCIPTRVAKL